MAKQKAAAKPKAAPKAKAPKVPKEPKAKRDPLPKENGVTRPKAGTSTGRVWEIVEQLKGRKADVPKRAEVIEAAVAEGINPSTAATQYGRWRQFHGFMREPRSDKKAA